MDALSAVLAALADPTRRDIVARLAHGDATAGELAAPYAITPQAVSKHLRVLEEAGLVSRRREAQRRPAHLELEQLDLLTMWIERQRRTAVIQAAPEPEPVVESTAEPSSALHGGADRTFEPWDLGARRVNP